MRIRSFAYADRKPGWSVDTLELKDGINLFVGASGSGKTRVLNMLFNIGGFAAAGNRLGEGRWTLHFEHAGTEYTWICDGDLVEDEVHVREEKLWIGPPSRTEGVLFARSETEFLFANREIPKLDKGRSAIYLLREDDAIKPVHEAVSRILRRRFWSEDLSQAVSLQPVPRRVVQKLVVQALTSEFLEKLRAQGDRPCPGLGEGVLETAVAETDAEVLEYE